MEREDKNQKACKAPEADLLLQWGNRKRLNRDPSYGGRIRRKTSSGFLTFPEKQTPSSQQPTRFSRNSDPSENRRRSSEAPEKEEKYKGRIGSAVELNEVGKESMEDGKKEEVVWPKVYISLTSKEKEEDFMAMKGCKLPHRPKKRAKILQRTLLKKMLRSFCSPNFVLKLKVTLLVSPGAWLTNMCEERYEVKEKKNLKKRPSGLKAMGTMESDSE